MFIDNTPSSSKWTLAEVVTFTMSVAIMLWSYIERYNQTLCFTLGAIGILATAIMLIINPSYVYYNDEDNKNIVLRTCSAFPFFRTYREYPFPKSSLVSYKIDNSIFGLKKLLSITVSGLDPETKAPKQFVIEDVNISALKKENINKIKSSLDKIINK